MVGFCPLFMLWDFVHFSFCGILPLELFFSCGILSVWIFSCAISSQMHDSDSQLSTRMAFHFVRLHSTDSTPATASPGG